MSAQSSRKRAVAELEDPIEDALIATISPSSADTEHSRSTLYHSCLMDGQVLTSDHLGLIQYSPWC